MRRIALAFVLGSLGCSSSDDMTSDASDDGTMDSSSKMDAKTDTSMSDSPSNDGGMDSTPGDTGADDGSDDGSSDAPSDAPSDADDGGIILDGGGADGSICPPCMMGFACCTIMKSMNYGKCTNTACLACCM